MIFLPDNTPDKRISTRPFVIAILIALFAAAISYSIFNTYQVAGSPGLKEASITDFSNFERMRRQPDGKLTITPDEDSDSITKDAKNKQSGAKINGKSARKKKKACLT